MRPHEDITISKKGKMNGLDWMQAYRRTQHTWTHRIAEKTEKSHSQENSTSYRNAERNKVNRVSCVCAVCATYPGDSTACGRKIQFRCVNKVNK